MSIYLNACSMLISAMKFNLFAWWQWDSVRIVGCGQHVRIVWMFEFGRTAIWLLKLMREIREWMMYTCTNMGWVIWWYGLTSEYGHKFDFSAEMINYSGINVDGIVGANVFRISGVFGDYGVWFLPQSVIFLQEEWRLFLCYVIRWYTEIGLNIFFVQIHYLTDFFFAVNFLLSSYSNSRKCQKSPPVVRSPAALCSLIKNAKHTIKVLQCSAGKVVTIIRYPATVSFLSIAIAE